MFRRNSGSICAKALEDIVDKFNFYAPGIEVLEKARHALGHQIVETPDKAEEYNCQGYETQGDAWVDKLLTSLREAQMEAWSQSQGTAFAMPVFTLSPGAAAPYRSKVEYSTSLTRFVVNEQGWEAEFFSAPQGAEDRKCVVRVKVQKWTNTRFHFDKEWFEIPTGILNRFQADSYREWLTVVLSAVGRQHLVYLVVSSMFTLAERDKPKVFTPEELAEFRRRQKELDAELAAQPPLRYPTEEELEEDRWPQRT